METSEKETFSASELRYLGSLEAVRRVTPKRIYYTDAFRDEVVRRYRRGERPVRIFRDHGLDPMLIGHKRVERATERWLRDAQPPNAPAAHRPRKINRIGGGVSENSQRIQPHRSATGYGLGPSPDVLSNAIDDVPEHTDLTAAMESLDAHAVSDHPDVEYLPDAGSSERRPQRHRPDEVAQLCGQILDRLLSLDQRIAALESSLRRDAE